MYQLDALSSRADALAAMMIGHFGQGTNRLAKPTHPIDEAVRELSAPDWHLGGSMGTTGTNRPTSARYEGSQQMGRRSQLFGSRSHLFGTAGEADDAAGGIVSDDVQAVRRGVIRPENHIIRVIGKIVLNEEQRERLGKLEVRYIASDNPARTDVDEIQSRIGDSTIVLNNISTPITGPMMRSSPNLHFIQTWSTGTDNIDLEAARVLGIRVANVPGFSTEAVAEKTMGLIILAANNLQAAHAHALQGGWDYQQFRGMELRGKTLCLIGRGRIGQRVAELARVFGMRVILIGSNSSQADLHSALAQADVISLHCPYTASTHHLIGQQEFALMQGAIFINNSRGGVVDEDALLTAIEAGHIRFATMDVFEKEPPATNHPLLQHPNVFVTPHCTWNTEEAVRNLTDSAISNIELFVRGELTEFVV